MLFWISERNSSIGTVRHRLFDSAMEKYNNGRGACTRAHVQSHSYFVYPFVFIFFLFQLNRYVFPIGTYTAMAQLIIILLITDFLRWENQINNMDKIGINFDFISMTFFQIQANYCNNWCNWNHNMGIAIVDKNIAVVTNNSGLLCCVCVLWSRLFHVHLCKSIKRPLSGRNITHTCRTIGRQMLVRCNWSDTDSDTSDEHSWIEFHYVRCTDYGDHSGHHVAISRK